MSEDGTLTIRAGDDLSLVLTYKDEDGDAVDLSDYTARFQAYDNMTTEPVVDISTEDADPSLILGGAAGTIELDVPVEVTELIEAGRGTYGLKLYDHDLRPDTIISGAFVVLDNVVQEAVAP
jgi:hypothetical protein